MDDIRSSLDNIMERFNDSITHSAPKKLSFDRLSMSFTEDSVRVPKKRRIDNSLDNSSHNVSFNLSCTSQNNSFNDPMGPWQTRKLRAELIETNAIISQLQEQLGQQTKEQRAQLELAESKSEALKRQCDYTSARLLEMEQQLKVLHKREHTARQEANTACAELAQQRTKYETALNRAEQEKLQREEDARQVQHCISNELGEYKRISERAELQLQATQTELERIRVRHDEYKASAAKYEQLHADYQLQEQSLSTANARIKELEYEIESYADWKEVTKTSQARLLSVPELQAEVDRLRTHNKHLNTLIGEKLLLEEQVHDYKTRLDREEGARAEAAALQVKLTHVEQELKEWVKVAQDHCLANTLVSPMALRTRIEQLLQADIIRAAEKGHSESEAKQLQSKLRELEQKCAVYLKNFDDMNIVLKRHKSLRERLQRKLMIVCKERDFYKQLLENFDKDLTNSTNATHTADMTNDMQIRYRVEVLERTLTGYKEMCSTLEREMQAMRQHESLSDPTPGEFGYESVKKELDTLRMENERLRRRKDELELELEHRCLRGDFNMGNYKVLHLTENPAADAYEATKNIVEKLQAEIERLKRRNRKLEEESNEQTQSRFNETCSSGGAGGGMTMNFKEFNQLRAELESANGKMKKMKECFKAASKEFRDVCYMLLGYRIDRVGPNSHYRISSMYAESPDDYLSISVNESNCLALLESPYSQTLKPAIDQQLAANNSFPAFFAALTLELFQRATVTIT
ncbi:mitotic spindle assembly checkpoint protein MAD1 [Drosophila grimshawi]|uniref:GH20025 n=1 Tax=Drosophila grimshawi TaxID=7222 RepID=B4J7Y1_DROGR|nr:mitotic spindle assembly checkpoint protein MAD1 [Drosophila grimshawi]EDW02211.1 GH20025 [Drosophila grimshawi]